MQRLLLCLLFFVSFSCAAQDRAGQREVVFLSVNLIPMDQERVVPNQVVVVQNGKIKAMGTAGQVKYAKDAMVIDGKGKYLMPGLAEMHAHVPPVDDLEPMKEVLLLFCSKRRDHHPRHAGPPAPPGAAQQAAVG